MGLVLAVALAAAVQVHETRVPEGFVRAEVEAPRAKPASAQVPLPRPEAGEGRGEGGVTSAAPTPPPGPAPDPCRPERSAYLRRLLQMAGVEVDDPLALLDGLVGPGGWQGALLATPLGVLPGVDPVRPLAWDGELRSLGRDLAACARASATASR